MKPKLFFPAGLALLITMIAVPLPAGAVSTFHTSLGESTDNWSFETSGSMESITETADKGWLLKAGGYDASTHFARIKLKLPERLEIAPTTFYMKAVIELPEDFYNQHQSYFRIMNTDNYLTSLGGINVGAANANEFRTGISIYKSDRLLRVQAVHDNNPSKTFYVGSQLPTGEHTLELFGDVASVQPWWFKLDGAVVASGVDRLSPDTAPESERLITRLVAGIDGAASQDSNSFSLYLKDFEIANYDVTAGQATPSPSPNPSPAAKPGDANGDGVVDGIDYVIWLNHFGQTVSGPANGDFNNDGKVDGVDYVIWLINR